MISIYAVVELILSLYQWTLIARIALSWFRPNPHHPVVRFIYDMTEPVMRPFRSLLPPVGGLDLSPILVFIVFRWLSSAVLAFLWRLGL